MSEPTPAIGTKRCANGWRTVLNGEFSEKTSRTKEKAIAYGERVLAGLALWESARERQVVAVGKMDANPDRFGTARQT